MTDKVLILNRIKEAYSIKSNAEFARRLGISPQNLSNWYKRNTFDENLIQLKFTDVNANWLLTGEGDMLKSPKNSFSQLTEKEIGEVAAESFTEELMRMYEEGRIFPASVHNKAIAEKDRRIEELQRENWELRRRVDEGSK